MPQNELDQTRANAIAWSFLQAYYPYLNANPADLHRLYSADGILNHGDFENPKNSASSAVGTEQIRTQLTKSNLKGCKVMVTHADIQPCLVDKVLIVVLGELAIEDSPAYKFVQTFLVVPGSKPSTYDIANDILRFIPEDELEEKQEEEEEEKEEEKEKEVEEKDTSSVFSENEKEATPETVNGSAEELKEEAIPVSSDDSTVIINGDSSEKEELVAEEIAEEVAEEAQDDSKQPSKPLSWAAKAAKAAQVAKAAAPVAATTAKPKKFVAPTKDEVDPSISPVEAKFTTVKPKEKFKEYPIYIRGVKEPVTEQVLKSEIESNFGKTSFFKLNNYVALVDFAEKQSQLDALNKGELKIGEVVIKLEPRNKKKESSFVPAKKDQKKKPSPASNGNGKKKTGKKE